MNEVGRIGSDDWASTKKVQNVITSPKTTPIRPAGSLRVPPGVSGGPSTIEAMPPAEEVYVPLRPSLEEPTISADYNDLLSIQEMMPSIDEIAATNLPQDVKEAYLLTITRLQMLVEDLSNRHMQDVSRQFKTTMAEQDELNAQKIEMIQKKMLEADKASFWSDLAHIMDYFLNTLTIVLGGVLVATGVAATAGAFLIAAGGLGLLDRVARDTGAYELLISCFTQSKKMQEQIAGWIHAGVFLASLGMGLYGGIASAINGGARAAAAGLSMVDAMSKLEIAANLAKAGVETGKSWKESEIAQIRKALQFIEGRMSVVKFRLERQAQEANETLSMMRVITKATKDAIDKG